MNKKWIFLFSLMLCLFPKILISSNSKINDKFSKNQSDTVLFKKDIELGDNFKASQPDSAIIYYKKALTRFTNTTSMNRRENYLYALGYSKLAFSYFDLRQFDKASLCNSIAYKIAVRINALDIQGNMLMSKGAIYISISKYDSAVYFFKKVFEIAKITSDHKLEAKAYVNIGIVHAYRGNTDSAFIYFKRPVTIAEKLNDKELLAGAYNNIGLMYNNTGKLNEALSYYQKALDIYKEKKSSLDIIMCENNIASIYYDRNDYGEALNHFTIIAEKCMKVNDPMQLATAYHNMGEVYYDIHAYNEATIYYLKSIEIEEKLDNKRGVGMDYMSIGSVQVSNNNPEKALIYYQKALSIFTSIDYKPGLTKVYNKLGNVYLELNKPDLAIQNLNKAKDMAIKVQDNMELSAVYFYMAVAYKKTSDFQQAFLYYHKTIDLSEQLEDTETLGTACYNIANIYNTLGKNSQQVSKKKEYFQKARQYAVRAFQLSEKKQLPDLKVEAAKELKNVYEGLGDLEQALFYYDVYVQTTDSLYKKAQTESAVFAEARWQDQKRQQQIKFLEQERNLKNELINAKESENKKQRAVIYLLIAGIAVLILSASIISYYIRRQRKLEYQQQLNKISKLRLENARSRVSPHFLFNSLSTIQDELSDKPVVSKRLDAIVNMLRSSLLNVEKPSISLKEEMEFVSNYLLLQKVKFIDDLQTEIQIENNNLYGYKIPAMIVQIPVENAIKHGLAGKENGPKNLSINITEENKVLNISITDNGIGRKTEGENKKISGTGTGLKVISQTLHLLNSRNIGKIDFSIHDLKDGHENSAGTRVDISIPEDYIYAFE